MKKIILSCFQSGMGILLYKAIEYKMLNKKHLKLEDEVKEAQVLIFHECHVIYSGRISQSEPP